MKSTTIKITIGDALRQGIKHIDSLLERLKNSDGAHDLISAKKQKENYLKQLEESGQADQEVNLIIEEYGA